MTQAFKVELLHGFVEGGRRHTMAELRDPTGHDEAMLAELRRDATPAECVTGLLMSLILGIGEVKNLSIDRIRELTAGDRERIVLALCDRLLGPEADLVATCPSCGSLAEVTARFTDLASKGVIADSPIALSADAERWVARLRPPNGYDLERAARGGPEASRALIVSCIEELNDASGCGVEPSELPATCEAQVADALLTLDPVAESRTTIECPSCDGPIDALLDGFAILQSGLGGVGRVYEDVYRMARSYHWSEAEILALPIRRRRHYLAIANAAEAQP